MKRASDTSVVPRNTATSSTGKGRLRVNIRRFHAVARWSWNANDDVCGICQGPFEGAAPGVKYPGEDSPVVFGKCGHPFHLQCVSKWLEQPSSKNSCPYCRKEWEFGSNPVQQDDDEEVSMQMAAALDAGTRSY